MKRQEVYEANKDRFTRWGKTMADEHSTVMMALAIGHDHNNGRIMIFCPEMVTDYQLLQLLDGARKQLLDKMAKQN